MSIAEFYRGPVPQRAQKLVELQATQPWSQPFVNGSCLQYAPFSSLQISPYVKATQRLLRMRQMLPEDLVPNWYSDDYLCQNRSLWGVETDSYFGVVNELSDFYYQLLKLGIADNQTVRSLISARKHGDRINQERLILERLGSVDIYWIAELVGEDNLPDLALQYIDFMESRSRRLARPVVQTIPEIWDKLFGEEKGRLGEFKELLMAAYILQNQGQKFSSDKILVNELYALADFSDARLRPEIELILQLDRFLKEKPGMASSEPESGVLEGSNIRRLAPIESRFYFNLATLVEQYLSNVVSYCGLDRHSLVRLALLKQKLRMEIDDKVRAAFTGIKRRGGAKIDTRAVTKVITTLCLPDLVPHAIPEGFL